MTALARAEDTLEADQQDRLTRDEDVESRRVSAPVAFGPLPISQTAAEPEKAQPATAQLLIPTAPPVRHPFSLLQQWEGVVSTSPKDGEFAATLRDLTHPALVEEQATFFLEQVPLPDRGLVLPGAVFYWSIGYEDTATGTRRTISVLRFRRLPAWTRGDMRRLAHQVEKLKRLLAASH